MKSPMKGSFEMSASFFRVSGIDPNDGAKMAFVWCRSEDQDGFILVASTYIVGASTVRPPGIHPGQFSVAFLLPAHCLADSIIVTDDLDERRSLGDVVVEKCPTPNGFHSSQAPSIRGVQPPYPEIGQVLTGKVLSHDGPTMEIRS